jgi:hypothetical protein
LIYTVERFDRAYWADFESNRTITTTTTTERKTFSSAPRTTAKAETTDGATTIATKASVTKTSTPAHLTKDGKITAEEQQHRIDTGACFYCGEVGHMANQCSKKGQPRARASDPVASSSAPPAPPPTKPVPRQTARASITIASDSADSGND